MAAIACQALRQVWRTDTALLVPWDSVINELRVRKFQVGHDDLELLESLLPAQAWITFLFLRYRGHETLLVVVRRVDQCLVGQNKQLLSHAFVEHIGITVLKISPAASIDEQGVAREHAVIPEIGEVPVGMARGMQRL